MTRPDVLIFHRPAAAGDPSLVRLLADARLRVAAVQSQLFSTAGAGRIWLESGWQPGLSFGEVLAARAPRSGGLIVLSSGAVPRLNLADARRLVEVAGGGGFRGLTNNRYSSDVCAVGRAASLRDLPPLPSDNALPRWLEERAGFAVAELPGRDRLALDLDTPLDLALAAAAAGAPAWLSRLGREHRLAIPRCEELRALAADAHRELLVFGRSGARTLRWLERNVRCRVRFLAEERGLRASTPLAIAGADPEGGMRARPPRATLGRLLEARGPGALGDVVGELADGAILDTRVLMADRLGGDESVWPSAADRFASDLLRASDIEDPWLRALTAAAAASEQPILLGAHSLVGPGVPIVLAGVKRA